MTATPSTAPAERIRTYKRRSGRVTAGQTGAHARLWSELGIEVDGQPLDVAAVFGRSAPLVVEVGFGMGEATAEMAAAQPELDVLAVDVHTPGHGNLLRLLEQQSSTNVRVVSGDARVLLAEMLPPASATAIRVFFPDPWPKRRHAKRRLLTAEFVALVADRLVDGGILHLATDVAAYAREAAAALEPVPALERIDPPWRAQTRFERRAVRHGRASLDLAARRRVRGEVAPHRLPPPLVSN